MDEKDLAYIAGIIDGEGYIAINRRNVKNHWEYMERIRVVMLPKNIPKYLHEVFGGWFIKRKSSKGYEWGCGNIKSREICVKILPYLKLKTRQAEIILEMGKLKEFHKSHQHASPEIRKKKKDLYLELRNRHIYE